MPATDAAERAFRDATEAVADGRRVDFATLERTHPELTGRLKHLRLLASLAGISGAAPAPGPDWPSMEGERWGPLEVREKVGEGTFGEVYRAHDPVLVRDVALKLSRSDADAYDTHLREARRLARVRHPGVVVIHGIETHDERVGLWMDFVRGESLETRLDREGPLPPDEIVRIGVRLADALRAVHAADVIHGDVKAANVMVDADGEALLMDFGAGRESRASGEPVLGTPLAMAPELLDGEAPSASSDVYALGVLLYRLATARYPVVAATPRELRQELGTSGIPPVIAHAPHLPEQLAHVIDRALELDPEARTASAEELATALRAGPGARPAIPDDVPHHLPHPDTRFVGRAAEIAEVRAALRVGRVVTLTGVGGTGKTRLAIECAYRFAGIYPGGLQFVDLVGLDGEDAVSTELCRVAGLPAGPVTGRVERLAGWLGERAVLLVLDNAERVIDVVGRLVEDLLAAAPEVRILVTSRIPLGIDAETAIGVPPLAIPTDGEASKRSGTGHTGRGELDGEGPEADALVLFLDRARRARPTLSIGPDERAAAAAICRQVDGIPLLLELAAARVRTFGVREVATRLERSFGLLRDRHGDRRAEHATVEGVLRWSVDLLDEAERTLFARLSVFRGGWPLEAVEPVCADPIPEADATNPAPIMSIGGEDPAELLASLVDQSLVEFDGERYRLFEVVRSHAHHRLIERGEVRAVASRHLDWCVAYAGVERERVTGPDAPDAFRRLDLERRNIEEALRFEARAPGDVDRSFRLFNHAGLWWFARGTLEEAIRVVDRLLALPEAGTDVGLRGTADNVAACCMGELGDRYGAIARFQRVRDRWERLGERQNMAEPTANIGLMYGNLGDHETALRYIREALELHQAAGNRRGIMFTHLALGNEATHLGDLDLRRHHIESALEIQKELGDVRVRALATLDLAGVEARLGNLDRALELARESVAVRRELGDLRLVGSGLIQLAHLSIDAGLQDEAGTALRGAFEELRAYDAPPHARHGADVLGRWARIEQRPELAALAFAVAMEIDRSLQGDEWPVRDDVAAWFAEVGAELEPGRSAAIESRVHGRTTNDLLGELLSSW